MCGCSYTECISCCSIGRIGPGWGEVVEDPGPEEGWDMMDEGNPDEDIFGGVSQGTPIVTQTQETQWGVSVSFNEGRPLGEGCQ